jgi:hypothetical protein
VGIHDYDDDEDDDKESFVGDETNYVNKGAILKGSVSHTDMAIVRNSCTLSSLRYAFIKTRLKMELLCSCSLTSKVVQGK